MRVRSQPWQTGQRSSSRLMPPTTCADREPRASRMCRVAAQSGFAQGTHNLIAAERNPPQAETNRLGKHVRIRSQMHHGGLDQLMENAVVNGKLFAVVASR